MQVTNTLMLDMDTIKSSNLEFVSQSNKNNLPATLSTMTQEDTLLGQIIALHKPDDREIDVKSLLHFVKHITLFTDQTQDEASVDISKAVQSVIHHISELHKTMQDASNGEGKHDTSISLLGVMSGFSWDAKAVLVLASLAMNHGVWMLAQMYYASSPAPKNKGHDRLYRSLGFCQPKTLQLDAYYLYFSLINSSSKKPKENQLPNPALTILFQALIGLADCIIQLGELPSADLLRNVPEYDNAMSRIPVDVYDLIYVAVHCAAVITRFPSNNYEISDAEDNELSFYAAKLNKKTKEFTDQIKECNLFLGDSENFLPTRTSLGSSSIRRILDNSTALQITFPMKVPPLTHSLTVAEQTKVAKEYQIPIPETSRMDNREALEFFIKGGGDQRLQNDVDTIISRLKGKYVQLLVSDEDSSREEIFILDDIHQAAIQLQEEKFNILWIPLYSGLGMDHQFETQKRDMPWYAVPHPSTVSKEAAKFIKEKWQFQSKTNMLAVLDPQGTVLNINALHMLWIWGVAAFPCTRSRERALWKAETLSIEFLIDGIDETVSEWIAKDRHIFFYGGEDIEWVRKFATTVKRVANNMRIDIELMYVGKPSKGDQTTTSKIKTIIRTENLGLFLPDERMEWFFWSRLRSMFISKMSHQRGLEGEDRTTRQLKWLLGYETEKSWAVLGKGNAEVTHGPGSTVLQVLTMCDRTRISKAESFVDGFRSLLKQILESERVCCKVEFPNPSSWIPAMMRCPDPRCNGEMMDSKTVFQCCHDRTKK